jgi:hypothetical protein
MPSLKSILAATAVALVAAAQPSAPASAQVFKSRMDLGKKACEDKHGKFEIDGLITSDKYTCTFASEHKVDHCIASSGKCTTTETAAPKAAAAAPKAAAAAPAAAPAPAKSLAGTGDVSKSELKAICAKNKDWQYTVEPTGAYSCMDIANGIAMNCTAKGRCTENHVPVRAR